MDVSTILLTGALLLVAAPNELTGRVTDADGNPLANARVDVYTARPKIGRGLTCPSCYLDCAKSTQTGADGRFSIGELDPSLQFRVLILAPGRQPVLTDFLDPAQDEAGVQLAPRTKESRPQHVLRGRVVDAAGNPVAGALVEPRGAKTPDRRWSGSLPGVDPAAITDAGGSFELTSRDAKLAMDLKISAPGFAAHLTDLLDMQAGAERHEIALRRGVEVRGRLLFDGKAAAGRPVGIVQQDRSSTTFVGELAAETDSDGRFAFHDLQTNEAYAFFTRCSAEKPAPALDVRDVQTGPPESVVDLGDLHLHQGLSLAARVELPQGELLPADAKVHVGRNPAWDWADALLDDGGAFEVFGLAPEVVEVRVSVPGYEIDTSQFRFQMTRPDTFAIRLRESRTKVVIPLIPQP